MKFSALREKRDLWSVLKESPQPKVLYGMGDGADKILNICNERGIEISGVFASDDFAKGKIFRGFEVITYSEMCKRLGDFTVLLSFATSRPEVLGNIYRIAGQKTLYCPDVPVFGEGLFDSEFFCENYNKFEKVYNLLSDETSKKAYYNVIAGKLTGDISFLTGCETSVSEAYENIIQPGERFGYADIGAYNGDTIREFLSYSGGSDRIYAFEPDARNYRKLCEYADSEKLSNAKLFNYAAWNKDETLAFYSRSGRNSAGTTSHKNAKAAEINAVRAENFIDGCVDFINIDAEGSDFEAIDGLKNTLLKYRPTVSCAVYHRNEDMFRLPLELYEIYGGKCSLYLRHFSYLPAWDTNIYIKNAE